MNENCLIEKSSDDVDDQQQYFDSGSDVSNELNPFMFELNYDPKKWELLDAFFRQLID